MGTLTADCPRLAEHCPHKLPSSCRLTSTPNCCACADERPHSLTYRVYIDGVGFVHRGTRWQSYCWFCKSFWDARVEAAGLATSDTKIPEDPDQSEFVERWFEFHQGYRIQKHEDGREEQIPLHAEPLKDADPGHLPRTQEELESGQRNTLLSDRMRRDRTTDTLPSLHISVEDAFDQMLHEVEDEEEDEATPTSGSPVVAARPDDIATSPDQTPQAAQEANTRLDEAYAEAQAAVNSAQRVRDRAEARLNNANAELSAARERARRIRRQQITAGNFARVFGTREDVQNEDYVSPITSMFLRQAQWGRQMVERQREAQAQERQREAQEHSIMHGELDDVQLLISRALDNGETESTEDEDPASSVELAQVMSFRPQHIRDSHTFVNTPLPRSEAAQYPTQQQTNGLAETPRRDGNNTALQDYVVATRRLELTGMLRALAREANPSPSQLARIASLREQAAHLDAAQLRPPMPSDPPQSFQIFPGLDGDERPEPRSEEDLRVKLECKVCLQQVADTACLPCGHLSMCEWCAEQWVPTRKEDKTRPRDKGVRCPCCRARVKSRVKIYVG